MCGIAGVVSFADRDPAELAFSVALMGRGQRRRGPDGAGTWADQRVALGCVRLAVTGDEIGGAQPTVCPGAGRILVFNGELYEHERILRQFGVSPDPSRSDADALAMVLERHGPAGLADVRGSFAVACYEPRRARVLLVRDAVGKKPLYLARTATGWAFASTLGALHATVGPLVRRRDAEVEYLVFRSVGGMHSAFEDVEQVPPGSWVELGLDGSMRTGRWFRLPEPIDTVGAGDTVQQDVRRGIDAAVAARAATDREVALFLSGGLDSSIVAASMVRQHPDQRVRAYTVGYEGVGHEDESALARRLAARLDISHEVVHVAERDVPALMEEVAGLTEDPIQDPVTVPTLALAKAAASRTNVVLTGDGADEVWGGYDRYADPPPTIDGYLPRLAIFSPGELGLAEYPYTYFDGLEVGTADLDPLDRMMRLDIGGRLRNYHLSRVDKVTMGCGLEARCPFLDVRAVNLGMRVPGRVKRTDASAKVLLAQAFADDLPVWLLQRRKQPFSVPIGRWLAGPLRELANDLVGSRLSRSAAIVDSRPYLQAIDRGDGDNGPAASKVWSLLQLEIWDRSVAARLESRPRAA